MLNCFPFFYFLKKNIDEDIYQPKVMNREAKRKDEKKVKGMHCIILSLFFLVFNTRCGCPYTNFSSLCQACMRTTRLGSKKSDRSQKKSPNPFVQYRK